MPKKILRNREWREPLYVMDESVPFGYELEIIDYRQHQRRVDDRRSDEAKRYLHGTPIRLRSEYWSSYALP